MSSQNQRYYKSKASLERYYPVGRFGEHWEFGICRVVGYGVNRRGEWKLEILVTGDERLLVDNVEVNLISRLSSSVRDNIRQFLGISDV